MHRTISLIAVAAGLAIAAPASLANDHLQRAAELLTGSWRTASPVPAHEGEGETHVFMHVAPVGLIDVDHAFYVELAREDNAHEPYRQAIFQLYDYEGTLRLRTYEFRNVPGIQPTLVGLWAVPEVFPQLRRSDLIATLDVEFRPEGDGFRGSTPHPYPTGHGGAVNMTSTVELTSGRLVTTDRGLAADGSIAWGQDDGASYAFERTEPNVRAELLPGGLVVIDFARPEGEIEAGTGTDVTVEYKGWVQNLDAPVATGTQFASSERDGQPFTFPLPGRLIDGWNTGVPGATIGTLRRLVIPPELGYGERGAAGGQIPPNATLFFEIRVLDIRRATAAD